MQLATQKSEQDVLQTEATVRQFETDLDLSKVQVTAWICMLYILYDM